MGGKLARELCFYNSLRFSEPRDPKLDPGSTQLKCENEVIDHNMTKVERLAESSECYETKYEDNNHSNQVEYNEKGIDEEEEYFPIIFRNKNGRHLFGKSILMVIILGLLLISSKLISSFPVGLNHHSVEETTHSLKHLDQASKYGDVDSSSSREIVEVTYPYLRSSYGTSLKQELLIEHSFGNSWGKPKVVDYSPPKDLKFNKVALTLNTSVSGIQYDRLAHIFLNGAQLWRTSTIEPGGNTVYSHFTKDVSTYVSLFKQEGPLVFQLDNLVNDHYTGVFDIKLYIDYYYDESENQRGQELPYSANTIFDGRKNPDKVYPLGVGNVESPLTSLPSDKFKVELPELAPNTTRLKLDVFTSGNGNEEFWYTNVLNKYTDLYDDSNNLGHGSVRLVNVLYNGIKIGTITPQPVIFTGGFSPSFWSKIVSLNAFDLMSYTLDLTPLLPQLWQLQSSKTKTLEIEITNGDIDDNKIGQNWLTAANLLTWENSKVVKPFGEIITYGDLNDRKQVFSFATPIIKDLTLIINGIYPSELGAQVGFELDDGSMITTNVTTSSKGEISNVQLYTHNGDNQSVVHVGHTVKQITITDVDTNEIIEDLHESLSYPLTLHSTTKAEEEDIKLDIGLLLGKSVSVTSKQVETLKSKLVQNGTSTFYISPQGNHGSSEIDTRYKFQTFSPLKEVMYSRWVKTDHGQITYDGDDADLFETANDFNLTLPDNVPEVVQDNIEQAFMF